MPAAAVGKKSPYLKTGLDQMQGSDRPASLNNPMLPTPNLYSVETRGSFSGLKDHLLFLYGPVIHQSAQQL